MSPFSHSQSVRLEHLQRLVREGGGRGVLAPARQHLCADAAPDDLRDEIVRRRHGAGGRAQLVGLRVPALVVDRLGQHRAGGRQRAALAERPQRLVALAQVRLGEVGAAREQRRPRLVVGDRGLDAAELVADRVRLADQPPGGLGVPAHGVQRGERVEDHGDRHRAAAELIADRLAAADRLVGGHRPVRGGRRAPLQRLEQPAVVAGAPGVGRRVVPRLVGALDLALAPGDPAEQRPRAALAELVAVLREDLERPLGHLPGVGGPRPEVHPLPHDLSLDVRPGDQVGAPERLRALDRLVEHGPRLVEPPRLVQRAAELGEERDPRRVAGVAERGRALEQDRRRRSVAAHRRGAGGGGEPVRGRAAQLGRAARRARRGSGTPARGGGRRPRRRAARAAPARSRGARAGPRAAASAAPRRPHRGSARGRTGTRPRPRARSARRAAAPCARARAGGRRAPRARAPAGAPRPLRGGTCGPRRSRAPAPPARRGRGGRCVPPARCGG